jgi:protein-S-isoprenylcysteine O-methyltransferase Ste14
MHSVTAPITPSPAGGGRESTHWKQFVDYLVRRRVPISLVVFVALIAEDVLSGIKPHSLADFRDHHVLWGVSLVVTGLAIRSWAAGTLRKSAEITTTGPYNAVRHPLYVGSFLMMIGFCAIIDDGENILFVLGPILALYLLAVPGEPFAAWSLRQWLANREYQAVLASLAGLAALQLWRVA